MEWLKQLFKDKALTFDELVTAINAHNGDEANKENQIKLGNLGGGEYTSTAKHNSEIEKLNALLSGKSTELDTANGLIAELKKTAKGNEEIQGKISGYETQVTELQAQLLETKIKAALKVGLLAEKCSDIDYVSYVIDKKLKEQGKSLELDETENIKGWDELLSDVKVQLPAQFETAKGGGKNIEEIELPAHSGASGISKEEFAKMGYQSRLKLKQENPEVYAQMTGKSTI